MTRSTLTERLDALKPSGDVTLPKATTEAVGIETRQVFDPFEGKTVDISNNLVDRLEGKYAVGPIMPNGEPEFGWRQHETTPICKEAAQRIRAMQAERADLVKALEAYEQWEADLILRSDAWRGGMATLPTIPQDLWDRLIEIQAMRNAALACTRNKGDRVA